MTERLVVSIQSYLHVTSLEQGVYAMPRMVMHGGIKMSGCPKSLPCVARVLSRVKRCG